MQRHFVNALSLFGLLAGLLLVGTAVQAEELTGADIVQRCDKEMNAGKDQRNLLTVILKDSSGNEKKNVYRRYWKDYKGRKNIADKMVLFTEFPPDAKGTAFMRWGYMPGADKNAEQWLYLPSLGSIRRVSVRDPGDSFLGSDLTYQDISPRLLGQDEHQVLREETRDGQGYYVVESLPKESNPLYGKVVAWYQKAPEWADCNKRRVEFYDTRMQLLKVETLSWQRVDDAWLWDEVHVDNQLTGHSSVFRVTDASINNGLKDRYFTERMLKRGIND